MRTILILIAVVIIILAARRLLGTPRRENKPPTKSGQMVQCAHCGMFVPETEAISHHGHPYCSPAHRDADRDR